MNSDLAQIAREIRIDILRMFYKSRHGHLAPALSCVDILTVLYFAPILHIDSPSSPNRDRMILSKGHGCAALYAVLARAGFFPRQELLTFYQYNSRLVGHPTNRLPGIEVPTGSLGHGICFATGTALAAKLDNLDFKTFVILGDGESQEGSVWEAAEFAAQQKLTNLIAIIDYNHLQASGRIENIMDVAPLKDKWTAFGWNVYETDGHDVNEIKNTVSQAVSDNEKPSLIVAHTVKGKGVTIAENSESWHSRSPSDEQWEQICRDMKISLEDLENI